MQKHVSTVDREIKECKRDKKRDIENEKRDIEKHESTIVITISLELSDFRMCHLSVCQIKITILTSITTNNQLYILKK